MESSVKVQNLGKSYNIEKNNFLPQFRKKDQNTLQDKKAVAALSNVSFEIFKGDRLGVLGKNGAGKSTLLKIISKVTTPTLGQVEINGVVSSVLEFGAGFHQDLTGLEIIMNKSVPPEIMTEPSFFLFIKNFFIFIKNLCLFDLSKLWFTLDLFFKLFFFILGILVFMG